MDKSNYLRVSETIFGIDCPSQKPNHLYYYSQLYSFTLQLQTLYYIDVGDMTSTMSSEYSTDDHVILYSEQTSELGVYSIAKKLRN